MNIATLRKRFPVGRRVLIARWFGNEYANAIVIANDDHGVTVRVGRSGGIEVHVHISVVHRDLRVARLR